MSVSLALTNYPHHEFKLDVRASRRAFEVLASYFHVLEINSTMVGEQAHTKDQEKDQ
jgi:hypothetical protein